MASGELNPTCLYPAERLAEIGIGAWLLRRARRDGVKPIRLGRLNLYRGAELCEWVERQGKEKEGGSNGNC